MNASDDAEGKAGGIYVPYDIVRDGEGRLAQDAPCRACGYNLRGLLPQDGCPECGTAVAWSIIGDLLRYSPPQWTKRLARGISYTAAGVGFFAVALVSLTVAVLTCLFPSPSFSVVGLTLFLPLGMIATVLLVLGIWWLTTPEPARKEKVLLNARRVLRYGTVAAVVGNGIMLVRQGVVISHPVISTTTLQKLKNF